MTTDGLSARRILCLEHFGLASCAGWVCDIEDSNPRLNFVLAFCDTCGGMRWIQPLVEGHIISVFNLTQVKQRIAQCGFADAGAVVAWLNNWAVDATSVRGGP